MTESSEKPDRVITDGVGSDPEALERNAGPAGRTLLRVLNRAVGVQGRTIERYVDYLRARHTEALSLIHI